MTKDEKRHERSNGDTRLSLRSPSIEDERGEFQRFHDLAKNLMAVPKKEVDEQEREYRAQNENAKRRRPKLTG